MSCIENYPDIFTKIPSASTEDQEKELKEQNKRRKVLYLAVRHLLREHFSFDRDDSTTEDPSKFPAGFGKPKTGAAADADLLTEEKALFSAVYGLLLARNLEDPSYGRRERGTPSADDIVFREANETVVIVDRFVQDVTQAVKDYNANDELYKAVIEVLFREGATKWDAKGAPTETTLYTEQIAQVTERLIDLKVDPKNPQIRRLVVNALSQALGGMLEGHASGIDIQLPNLEVGAQVDITPDNVKAIAAIYFCAMLEEMKLFATTEKVAEHFVSGMLPVSRGPAGERIYEWIRGAPDRFTELERRSLYGRTLGLAQGAAQEQMPNRSFTDLWVRFLSSTAAFNRETEWVPVRRTTSMMVLKSARDLAVNVSLHGYAMAHFAAVELQKLVRDQIDLLSAPELLKAYGVNDHWQLVERVSAMYLGGAANGVKQRTMAQSGSEIMLWIAKNAPLLSVDGRDDNGNLFRDPYLVPRVESWLAITGTQEQSVQQYSSPVELRQQPTVPQVPAIGGSAQNALRNVIERTGINLPNISPVPQA